MSEVNSVQRLEAGNWALLSINCAAILWLTLKRLTFEKNLGPLDCLIVFAFIVSIGDSVATYIESDRGYGRPPATVTKSEFVNAEKANYVGNVLYTVTIFAAKFWLIPYSWGLTRRKLERGLIAGLGFVIAGWSIGSFFTTVFKCSLPKPFDSEAGTCINKIHFWTSYDVLVAITDILLVGLSSLIVLRSESTKRFPLIATYSIRLIVVAPAICHAVFTNDMRGKNLDDWKVVEMRGIVISLSIVASCVVKSIADSLHSEKRATGASRGHGSFASDETPRADSPSGSADRTKSEV